MFEPKYEKSMKKFFMNPVLTILVLLLGVAGCTASKKGKITDIPVTTTSKEALASVREGLVMMDQGDGQKAKAWFTKAIEQDPKIAIAYILRAGQSQSPKEFKDGLDQAKANLEGVSDWEKWYYDFYATFLTGDWNKRLEITRKIADSFPDAPRALVDLGFVYMGGNQVARGRESFEKAVKLDTSWTGGYYALYQSYLFNAPKDFRKAEENAVIVSRLAPASPGAEIALGDCYRAENDLDKARDTYAKAITLDPSTSEPYYKKGHSETFLGRYDEARQDYMDGGKHDEGMTMANQFNGFIYLYTGEYKKGLDYFTELAANADASGQPADRILNNKSTYYTYCLQIAFHYGDAARVKEVAVLLEPVSLKLAEYTGTQEQSLYQKAQTLYWQALAAAMTGKYDQAAGKAGEIRTVLEPIQDPNKLSDYEFVLGYISLKQKKYDAAISHFEKTNPSDIYNKYWLARTYEAAGKEDQAKALFNEIAIFNFNELGYALVRNEVTKKLETDKNKKIVGSLQVWPLKKMAAPADIFYAGSYGGC
jgi:tetratricopeptide (TPR) repeat protein